LVITLIKCGSQPFEAAEAAESRVVESGEFTIGRGPNNDWVLPDPHRYVSQSHCTISSHMGELLVTDTSTNGLFINSAPLALGRGNTAKLLNGDTLTIGDYRFLVSITAEDKSACAETNNGSRSDKSIDVKAIEDLDPFGLKQLQSEAVRSVYERERLSLPYGEQERGSATSIGRPTDLTMIFPSAADRGAGTPCALDQNIANDPGHKVADNGLPMTADAGSDRECTAIEASQLSLLQAFFDGAGFSDQKMPVRLTTDVMRNLGQTIRTCLQVEMVKNFNPEKIKQVAPSNSLATRILPRLQKARYWDHFESAYYEMLAKMNGFGEDSD